MSNTGDLSSGLQALAHRSVGIMAACANQESAKLYLALPFLSWLGYDTANPYEVYPNHIAADQDGPKGRVDFAVLRGADPIIAIEVGEVGSDPARTARALRSYFDAASSVRLGIATDGIVFDLYVDTEQPGRMDDEAFLSFDLEAIARSGVTEDLTEPLAAIGKGRFDPTAIAELAHVLIVKRRLRTVLLEEAKGPSHDFCRFALQRIGLKNVRPEAIERHYAPMVRAAFEESLVMPVVERLRGEGMTTASAANAQLQAVEQRMARTERELSLLAYVRRRLAYLIETEAQFAGLDDVFMKDYLGRTTFFYHRERKGRLFDVIEASDGNHRYIFPDPIGSISTSRLSDLDEALKAVYEARVHEFGSISLQARKRIA